MQEEMPQLMAVLGKVIHIEKTTYKDPGSHRETRHVFSEMLHRWSCCVFHRFEHHKVYVSKLLIIAWEVSHFYLV